MAVVAKHFIVGKGVHNPDPNRLRPVSSPLHTHRPEGSIQAVLLIAAPQLPGQHRKSLLFRSSYWRPAFSGVGPLEVGSSRRHGCGRKDFPAGAAATGTGRLGPGRAPTRQLEGGASHHPAAFRGRSRHIPVPHALGFGAAAGRR